MKFVYLSLPISLILAHGYEEEQMRIDMLKESLADIFSIPLDQLTSQRECITEPNGEIQW